MIRFYLKITLILQISVRTLAFDGQNRNGFPTKKKFENNV